MADIKHTREADAEWSAGLTAVLETVRDERKRQLEKWGPQSHTQEKWLAILMEEVGEAAEEVLREPSNVDNLYKELIQVSAVAAAFAQALLNGSQTENNKS